MYNGFIGDVDFHRSDSSALYIISSTSGVFEKPSNNNTNQITSTGDGNSNKSFYFRLNPSKVMAPLLLFL